MRISRILVARMKLAFIITVIFLGLLMAGAFIPLGAEEGEALEKELEKLGENSLELGIFLNNFGVALLAAIPFAGPPIAGYIIFHTGRFLGWISVQSGIPLTFVIPFALLLILFSGYGILEFLGYGVATAESLTISYYILKSRRLLKRELKILLITILISALLLALGAIIEAALIRSI